MKKEIMKRAWNIARAAASRFGGKVKSYFSGSLVLAWKEFKNFIKKEVVKMKKEFKGYAKGEFGKYEGVSYTFRLWEKNGMRRIYVSYRDKKSAGYIDLNNNRELVTNCDAYKEAMIDFLNTYDVGL